MENLFDQLKELHRAREDYHGQEKSLTLRIKAICRRACDGDLKEAGKLYKVVAAGEVHPITNWCLPFLEARAIVATARKAREKEMTKLATALPHYDWVQGVRGFGPLSYGQLLAETGALTNYENPAKVWKRMGLAVIDGERQRKIAGDKALEHGYSPRRRSIVWNIGDCIIKAGSPQYRPIYDHQKEIELARCETKGHAHNRAKRYMEKRVLRDLWEEWAA